MIRTIIDITEWLEAKYNSAFTNRDVLYAIGDPDNSYHAIQVFQADDESDWLSSYDFVIEWPNASRTESHSFIAVPDSKDQINDELDDWLRIVINDTLDRSCGPSDELYAILNSD